MKKFRYIASAILAVLVLASGLGARHVYQVESARQERAANAPQFFYAVDPRTEKVETYSIIPGEMKLVGEGYAVRPGTAHNVGSLPWDGCWYSFVATCPKPVGAVMIVQHPAGDSPQDTSIGVAPVLPRVVWTDIQGQYQQQFFKKGIVVYLSDHPLATDSDDILVEVPSVAAAS